MSRLTRRLLLAAPPLLAGLGAVAQEPTPYPDRPITLIAPFSAGGTADRAARMLAQHAPAHLPNRAGKILVENRSGASGALGTLAVSRAAPNGMTLLLARVASSAILPALDPRTPYQWDDFSMLGLLDQSPFTVCVRAEAPWQKLNELMTALREQPGQLRFATTGPATVLDLGMRELFSLAGLPYDSATAVPFAGAGDALQALLDQKVDIMGSNLSDALAAIQAKKVRALVVGSLERLDVLPGVPTAREAELPTLTRIAGWSALFAPPRLPDPFVEIWSKALAALRTDTGWLRATRAEGNVPMLLAPEATRAFIGDQVAFYRDLGRRLGLA